MVKTLAANRFDNAVRYRATDHPAQTAITPRYLIDPLREVLGGLDLDPCTTPDNPLGAFKFYALPDDGLSLPWDGQTVYVNPPYGKAREPWVERCIREAKTGKRIALLIPVATDTRAFHRATAAASSVLFVRGRLKFGILRPNRRQVAASHPSAVFGFNVDLSPLHRLGRVMRASTT